MVTNPYIDAKAAIHLPKVRGSESEAAGLNRVHQRSDLPGAGEGLLASSAEGLSVINGGALSCDERTRVRRVARERQCKLRCRFVSVRKVESRYPLQALAQTP